MPHVVVEYTANLGPAARIGDLLPAINRYLIDQRGGPDTGGGPVFPVGGIRSRAIELVDYCVSDGGDPDDAFVHVRITIGAGRDPSVRKRVHDGLFELLKAHFAPVAEERGLALSMEAGEFDEAGTWKHNNLHARASERTRR